MATAAIVAPAMLAFLVHGSLVKLSVRDPHRRRRRLIKNVQWYSQLALRLLRVKTKVQRASSKPLPPNSLLVCNHMSYLDLMILAAKFPAVFVTSVDMGQVFFLGHMAEIGGSLFVERRNRDRLNQDITQIQNTLQAGFDVILFPEGTSSDGTSVLPFRRSLLNAAAQAGVPILPLTLKYRQVEDRAFGPGNRDVVCWYGDKDFVSHFLRLLAAKSVHAEVVVHEPVLFSAAGDLHQVGDHLHRTISQEYLKTEMNNEGDHHERSRQRRQTVDENISRGPREKTNLTENPRVPQLY